MEGRERVGEERGGGGGGDKKRWMSVCGGISGGKEGSKEVEGVREGRGG